MQRFKTTRIWLNSNFQVAIEVGVNLKEGGDSAWKKQERKSGSGGFKAMPGGSNRTARNWRWFKLAALSTCRLTYLPPRLLNTPAPPLLLFSLFIFFPSPSFRPIPPSTEFRSLSVAFILFVARPRSFLSSWRETRSSGPRIYNSCSRSLQRETCALTLIEVYERFVAMCFRFIRWFDLNSRVGGQKSLS